MSADAQERTPKAGPSPIDFSLWLRTEACRQSRKIDALHRRAGPPARTSYLEIRQRRPTECYCRQFWFFRSFYGSSEPGMPLNDHSIPSNPLRPLSPFIIPPDEQPLARESCPMQDDPETRTAGRGHTAGACESPGSVLNVSRWSRGANSWLPAAASALPAPTASRSTALSSAPYRRTSTCG